MNDSVLALLAGLVGSILTVLITKIFDLFQKKNEFKYILKKEYFNKKINSLERASIQYNLLIGSIGNLAKLFLVISSKEINLEKNVLKNFKDSIDKQIEKVSQSVNDIGLAIFNYIDLEQKDYYNFQKVEELLLLIGRIGMVNKKIHFLTESLNNCGNKIDEDKLKKEIDLDKLEMQTLVQDLSIKLEALKEIFFTIQNKIRNDLKKFE